MDIDQIARWLKKTWRDKLCKVLQYVCRLLARYFQNRSEYQVLIYQSLFQSIRDARKLFRLFKSINEFQSLKELVLYGEENISTVLYICARSLYFIYWICDNLAVASRVKIFSFKSETFSRVGIRLRIVAIILSLIAFVYEIIGKNLPQSTRRTLKIKALRNLLDITPALKDSGLINFDEYYVSLSGLCSAFVSTYQIYQQTFTQ